MTPDAHHIAMAAADLGDEFASEIRACEETLKTECDLQRRRVAENRYLRLTDRANRSERNAA